MHTHSRNWQNGILKTENEMEILGELYANDLTYTELKRLTGLSDPVLSQHLKNLILKNFISQDVKISGKTKTSLIYKLEKDVRRSFDADKGVLYLQILPTKRKPKQKAKDYLNEYQVKRSDLKKSHIDLEKYLIKLVKDSQPAKHVHGKGCYDSIGNPFHKID